MTSRLALAVGLTIGTVACSGGGSSTTAPTTAPTPPTTEMFTGVVAAGGSDTHTFNVALSNGALNVTLTSAGPPATITMGLGLGTPQTDGSCSLLTNAAVFAQAGTNPQLAGTASAGPFCVVVFDVGNQVADVTYAVTVTHY